MYFRAPYSRSADIQRPGSTELHCRWGAFEANKGNSCSATSDQAREHRSDRVQDCGRVILYRFCPQCLACFCSSNMDDNVVHWSHSPKQQSYLIVYSRRDSCHLRAHYIGEIVAGTRAAQIAE